MSVICNIFAFIVQFFSFLVTGQYISFTTVFDNLDTFYNSLDDITNIIAWACALLPIDLIKILLTAILVLYVIMWAVHTTKWLIDVIVP